MEYRIEIVARARSLFTGLRLAAANTQKLKLFISMYDFAEIPLTYTASIDGFHFVGSGREDIDPSPSEQTHAATSH